MTSRLIFFIALSPFIFLLACDNKSGTPTNGTKTIYFPETEIVRQTVEYKNGKKNGYVKDYYKNGILKASQFYVNDTLDDTTRLYHLDGKLKTIQIYKNKDKHGAWRDYNKQGGMYSEIFFKRGFIDSTCSKYSYNSLRLLTRVTYNQGLKHGWEEKYYPSGKPESRVCYDMGSVCKGTEEWMENGKKRNNDFAIYISESGKVMLDNSIIYTIRLENPRPDDQVFHVVRPDTGNKVGTIFPLKKKDDAFLLEFSVPKGGFVMEQVTIAAYRKTSSNNTFIKTQSFNAASNNF